MRRHGGMAVDDPSERQCSVLADRVRWPVLIHGCSGAHAQQGSREVRCRRASQRSCFSPYRRIDVRGRLQLGIVDVGCKHQRESFRIPFSSQTGPVGAAVAETAARVEWCVVSRRRRRRQTRDSPLAPRWCTIHQDPAVQQHHNASGWAGRRGASWRPSSVRSFAGLLDPHYQVGLVARVRIFAELIPHRVDHRLEQQLSQLLSHLLDHPVCVGPVGRG